MRRSITYSLLSEEGVVCEVNEFRGVRGSFASRSVAATLIDLAALHVEVKQKQFPRP